MVVKIKGKIGRIIKNGFIRRVATLFGGSAIGQLILFLFTPFLARFYSAEAFGVFTVYSSVLMISSIVSTLRYEYAIALPEHEEDANELLLLNFILSFFISLLVALFVLLLNKKINLLLGLPVDSQAFYFLPIATFLSGGIAAMNFFLVRKNRYRSISTAGLIKNCTTVGIQSIAIPISNGLGLIVGAVSGLIFSSASFTAAIFKLGKRPLHEINWRKLCSLALTYKKIPIYTLTADLTGNLSAQLPTILVGSIFGLKAAAFYGIANRLVMTPLQMIALSVGQVFYGQAANNSRANKQQYPLVKRTVMYLLLMGSLSLLAAAIGADQLFDMVLGAKWHEAALFARILAPWWLASFVSIPVIDLFSVLGLQKYQLAFMSAQLAIRASCLYIGALIFHELVATLAVLSCASAVLSFFLVFVLLKKTKDMDEQNKSE